MTGVQTCALPICQGRARPRGAALGATPPRNFERVSPLSSSDGISTKRPPFQALLSALRCHASSKTSPFLALLPNSPSTHLPDPPFPRSPFWTPYLTFPPTAPFPRHASSQSSHLRPPLSDILARVPYASHLQQSYQATGLERFFQERWQVQQVGKICLVMSGEVFAGMHFSLLTSSFLFQY